MNNPAWRFEGNERKYLEEVLSTGFRAGADGAFTTRLESYFSDKYNVPYSIAFNSGTSTLHATLLAMKCGPGDEILTPALTPLMCGLAPHYTGATPVFVDSTPDTFLMDPIDIERKITNKTKVIFVTHMYGAVCDMDAIMAIAKKNNLKVLEDCAQCYSAKHNNQISGTIGDIGSWSFENSKHLSCGDGGIVCLDDEEIADYLRKLSTQGFKNATAKSGKIRVSKDLFQNPSYTRHSHYGFMYRLPEVAAAIGLAQVEKMKWFVDKRILMASIYKEVISDLKCDWLIPQATPEGDINSYYTFAAKMVNSDIKWADFRKKYVDFGGDGVYAAWTLCYREDSIDDILKRLKKIGYNGLKSSLGILPKFKYHDGLCPNAEKVQTQLMQFTTNQKNIEEMKVQADILHKTISYFN